MFNFRENLLNILREQLVARLGPSYQWGGYWPSILWRILRLANNLLIHKSVNEPANELIQQETPSTKQTTVNTFYEDEEKEDASFD